MVEDRFHAFAKPLSTYSSYLCTAERLRSLRCCPIALSLHTAASFRNIDEQDLELRLLSVWLADRASCVVSCLEWHSLAQQLEIPSMPSPSTSYSSILSEAASLGSLLSPATASESLGGERDSSLSPSGQGHGAQY